MIIYISGKFFCANPMLFCRMGDRFCQKTRGKDAVHSVRVGPLSKTPFRAYLNYVSCCIKLSFSPHKAQFAASQNLVFPSDSLRRSSTNLVTVTVTVRFSGSNMLFWGQNPRPIQ